MKRVLARGILYGGAAVAIFVLTGMFARKGTQERTVARLWHQLADADSAGVFDPAMVEGLPEPARRWLLYAIAEGTPLSSTALLRMRGTLQLRQDAAPWLMRAEQVLAPPRGFVWRAEVGSGLQRIRGYDRYSAGEGEVRWWLFGLLPVVAERGPDVARSAAGRLGGEATLVPASLLPVYGVAWEAVDQNMARATMDVSGEAVSFTIAVAPSGRLQRVVIRRWNGDPANGAVGYMPFVVEFEGERVFDGYTVPAHVRAGWEDAGVVRFFFDAELTDVQYR